MKLLKKYGEKGSEKFFPIKASDYDPKIINMAQQGYLPMFDGDEELINEQTGGKFDEYFEILPTPPQLFDDMGMEQYADYDFVVKVKDSLRNKIEFKVADATEQCKLVEPDNSIVMARNCWPYLKDESKRMTLADDLYRTLGKNSAVVVGKFDDTSGAFASKNLSDAGFVCRDDNYCILEKNSVPYNAYYLS